MLGYHKKEVRDKVIREIWESGPLDCLQIGQVSGFGSAYTHKLVKFLLKKGIICRESGSIPRGRKPYLYYVNPEIGFVVGVELDDKCVTMIICDFSLISFRKFSYTIKISPSTMIEDTARLIRRSLNECGIPLQKVRGVGVGLHGIIDFSSHSLIKFHQASDFVNIRIKEGLERELHKIPVFIEDNNRASVLAEKEFGQAKSVKNFVYIRVSSGVGMGMYINGECYGGDTGLAGEIGHIIIKRNGHPCYCGNFGCLETLISNDALCGLALKRLKDGVESELRSKWIENKERLEVSDIVNAGVEGDKLATEIIKEAGEALGHALAIVVNTLNIGTIILDGELTHASDIFMYPIMQVVGSEAIQQSANHVHIIFSKLGEESVARGALIIVLDEIFEQLSQYVDI